MAAALAMHRRMFIDLSPEGVHKVILEELASRRFRVNIATDTLVEGRVDYPFATRVKGAFAKSTDMPLLVAVQSMINNGVTTVIISAVDYSGFGGKAGRGEWCERALNEAVDALTGALS